MKMYTIKLNHDLICEQCLEKSRDNFGIISKLDLENSEHTNETMTDQQRAKFLIFKKEIGTILCQKCLDEKKK